MPNLGLKAFHILLQVQGLTFVTALKDARTRPLQFRRKPPGRRRGQGRRKTRCGLKLVVS